MIKQTHHEDVEILLEHFKYEKQADAKSNFSMPKISAFKKPLLDCSLHHALGKSMHKMMKSFFSSYIDFVFRDFEISVSLFCNQLSEEQELDELI